MTPEIEQAGKSDDDIAASILRKLGGGEPERPRDERGRFTAQQQQQAEAEEQNSPTPESGEPQEGEADEGALPEDVENESESEETQETPQAYTVKVNGQDESVTLDALIASYSKDADYRQKTETLKRDRETWEATREQSLKAERDALQADRENAKQVLDGWRQFIEAQFGNQQYWDSLRQENPGEWAARQYALQQTLQGIESQAAELRKKDEEKRSSELTMRRTTEYQKLVEAVPEWKDQAKLNEGYQKFASYAVKVRGFRPEELPAVAMDHRLALVLHDAAQWHALSQKKPEIAPKLKTIRPAHPGQAPQPGAAKAKTDKTAYDRFAKSGRTDDLAVHLARKLNLTG